MILFRLTRMLDCFVDSNSRGFSSSPFKFNRDIITPLYNIDYAWEFFKKHGNSKYLR